MIRLLRENQHQESSVIFVMSLIYMKPKIVLSSLQTAQFHLNNPGRRRIRNSQNRESIARAVKVGSFWLFYSDFIFNVLLFFLVFGHEAGECPDDEFF